MFKKCLVTCFCVMVLAIGCVANAADMEAILDDSTSSTGFSVKDNNENTLMRVQGDGNVGIGTTAPRSKLEVNGDIKFGNESAGCGANNEGTQRYNSISKKMEFCNGTVWAEVGVGGGLQVKAGTFTRNMTTETGTQAIIGVGFQPTAILLTAAIANAEGGSIGWVAGSTNLDLQFFVSGFSDTMQVTSSSLITIFTSAGNRQLATFRSFDSDGFTVNWTKQGSPTGEATIGYMAFR